MQRITVARTVLIAGLAFVFGYAGIDKFLTPALWLGWMPGWAEGLAGLTRQTWLQIVGTAEIAIAVLLLLPHRSVRRAGAALAALHLLAILTQTGWNPVALRDIGLLAASMGLFFLL